MVVRWHLYVTEVYSWTVKDACQCGGHASDIARSTLSWRALLALDWQIGFECWGV